MKRILVVRNDKIGDFMLAWPSFAMLKGSMACHVTALVPAYTAPLARLCPWIDEVIIDPGVGADKEQQRALLARIKRYPQVKAVLWGHVHQHWDQAHEGVRYLATPSTCIQFAPGSEDFKVSEEQPGYRWLRLHEDGRLETGVERARDFVVTLDFDSPGY